MLYNVHHAIHPTFGFKVEQNPAFNFENYSHVASVECDSLNHVYEVTNHISRDWTTNPEVKWRRGDGANTRSTSCGDVILEKDSGKKFMVLGAGFGEI